MPALYVPAVLSATLRVALPASVRAAGQKSQRRQRNSREPASPGARNTLTCMVSPADGNDGLSGGAARRITGFVPPQLHVLACYARGRGIGPQSRLFTLLGLGLERAVCPARLVQFDVSIGL